MNANKTHKNKGFTAATIASKLGTEMAMPTLTDYLAAELPIKLF